MAILRCPLRGTNYPTWLGSLVWTAVAVIVGLAISWGFWGAQAWGQLTPESPEVRAAVQRGLAFLQTHSDTTQQIGAWALLGLAFYKTQHPPSHPMIQKAVDEILKHIPQSGQAQDFTISSWDNYSTGLSLIFLCNLDPQKYRREIEAILRYSLFRQKPHGGWGYPSSAPDQGTGDTSQTQYEVLGLWEAVRAGFPVPTEVLNRAATWLIWTQDPSGGYGYQGQFPDRPQLIPQSEVRIGMAVAGTGSAYVLASLAPGMRGSRASEGLPPALQRVDTARSTGGGMITVDLSLLRTAIQRGNAYIEKNFQIEPNRYRYYYIYSLERYFTFRELVDGPDPSIPDWYTLGAEYLLKTQQPDGSWNHQCGKNVDTSFAILFFVRSTKQSVKDVRNFTAGILVGSRGLPKDTDNIVVKDGQITALPMSTSPEALISVLDSPELVDLASAIESLQQAPPEQIKLLLSDEAVKLHRLAGSDEPAARIVAITAMGKSGDLSHVPTLIYALEDPNRDVVLAADRALRRLTRRFGPGLQPGFSESERQATIQDWQKWYKTINPLAEFAN